MSNGPENLLSHALVAQGEVLRRRILGELNPLEYRIAMARFFGEPIATLETLAKRHKVPVRKIPEIERRAWSVILGMDNGITARQIVDFRRRKTLEQSRIEPEIEIVDHMSNGASERRSAVPRLAKCLHLLSPTERSVFIACQILRDGPDRDRQLALLRRDGIHIGDIERKVSDRVHCALGFDTLAQALSDLRTMQQTGFMYP